MKVFVSWSGERSGRLATALGNWLPKVIQTIKPWLSSASIDAGVRWNDEVARALEEMQYGVLCLTPENLASPWVLFEAGALSKAVSVSRVVPYLLGFEPRELEGPLSQFQAVRADQEGTLRLITVLNKAGGQPLGSSDALSETFDVWWPKLEPELSRLASVSVARSQPPARSAEDMLGEVLELLRGQRLNASDEGGAEDTSSVLPISERTVGSIIRALRIKRRWTPGELGNRSGIPPATLSAIESGSVLPSATTLRLIGNAFGVNLFAFVEPSRDLSIDDTSRESA